MSFITDLSDMRNRAAATLLETEEAKQFAAINAAVVKLGGSNLDPFAIEPASTPRSLNQRMVKPELVQTASGFSFSTRGRRVEVAKRALKKLAQPATTPELLVAMEQMGYRVGGENPELNLSSTLSRSADFDSLRQGGKAVWWFKGQLLPKQNAEMEGAGSQTQPSTPFDITSQEGGDLNA